MSRLNPPARPGIQLLALSFNIIQWAKVTFHLVFYYFNGFLERRLAGERLGKALCSAPQGHNETLFFRAKHLSWPQAICTK